MSVVRQLVAISAVQAMRGATLAGVNVFDSKIESLEGLMANDTKPAIIVSVEEVNQQRKNDHGLLDRSSDGKIFIQTGVWSQVTIENGEDAGNYITVGETDAAREASLNILDRQWRAALTDPRNPWADLFKRLAYEVTGVRDMRMSDPENTARLAARFTEISVLLVNEPALGQGIPEDIEAGLKMLEQTTDYAHLAPIWRALLTSEESDWRAFQARIFASDIVMSALGFPASDDDLPELASVTIAIDGLDNVVVVP
jgi:hypothetical protein